MSDELTVKDVLSVYELSPEHRATLELAACTDSMEAVQQYEPGLTDALRALRQQANEEAEFNAENQQPH